jgi:predicted TIM-barrel fold metal-dependent hydrolase
MTRREFMRSAAGTATAFMVLNTVHGLPSTGRAASLPVTREQCDDPDAARELFRSDRFVMDVQLHHVDLTVFQPGTVWEDLLCGLRFLDPGTCAERYGLLSQMNFVKEVFVDSETAVGVLSGVPNGIPLPVETMKETRDLVNGLAGSERALAQAMIDPTTMSGTQVALDTLEHQVVDNGACAIKCYTGSGSWWLDDETIAYPMYEEAVRLGIDTINVHKGFPALVGGMDDTYVRTRDLAKATDDWPHLRFVVYHSGYFQDGTEISGFLADLETMGRRRNLYAEIGSSFAVAFLLGRAAHLVGSLLKALGPNRILWGTDSIWWGSPQWQIDAFKALTIPPAMQEEFGYPPLTDRVKARILGRNAAKLYKVRPSRRRCEIPEDQLARARRGAGGMESSRTHFVYGPQSPHDFELLLAHEGGAAKALA